MNSQGAGVRERRSPEFFLPGALMYELGSDEEPDALLTVLCTAAGVTAFLYHDGRLSYAAHPGEVVRIVVELLRRSWWGDGQTVTGSATS
jgi:hypothetical protein